MDAELASGQNFANVLYRQKGGFIWTVAEGEENFLILINLPNGDFAPLARVWIEIWQTLT